MQKRQIHLIIDMLYGSTGKGSLACKMSRDLNPDTIALAFMPNAGHRSITKDGRMFTHMMMPNGINGVGLKRILMGAGSAIDPDILQSEYEACNDLLKDVVLAIHPHAAMVTQRHRDEEAGFHAIGSTKKGCGAALIQRIRRNPEDSNLAKDSDHPFIKEHVVTTQRYNSLMDESKIMLVESAQGHSLSLYHGFAPYTTSRDVTPHQILADCGIPRNFGELTVYGTCRTYPIRVANRFNEAGEQVGFSGPCYPDQHEIQWSDLGMEAELTTVTKLPRRIFTFSDLQYKEAVRMCGVDKVFLSFADYLPTQQEAYEFAKRLNTLSSAQVRYIGIGPTENDVREVDMASFPEVHKLDGFKTSLGATK